MAIAAGGSRLAVSACDLGELDERETEFLRLIRELQRLDPAEYERFNLLLIRGVYGK